MLPYVGRLGSGGRVGLVPTGTEKTGLAMSGVLFREYDPSWGYDPLLFQRVLCDLVASFDLASSYLMALHAVQSHTNRTAIRAGRGSSLFDPTKPDPWMDPTHVQLRHRFFYTLVIHVPQRN